MFELGGTRSSNCGSNSRVPSSFSFLFLPVSKLAGDRPGKAEMQSKKRRREDPPSIHPRNRYSEKQPDFDLLASLYPSFQPYVFTSGRRPSIDWTDFNATRELTRVLLLHDHGVNWWIPDGNLCPTVPNRSNYIHWIEDLLSSQLIPPWQNSDRKVRGFDIGTGANCIYPLLGASLLGWSFVGSDFTDVALQWAKKNVESNPHLSDLIEIRRANKVACSVELQSDSVETVRDKDTNITAGEEEVDPLKVGSCSEPCVLVGVVREDEKFDFCMCNPPFFESIEEAGQNPKTSCGGTSEEMVCPGGESAFVTRIIIDSLELKNSFRWFTSMVGRKASLKFLVSKIHKVGASVVRTTEFVQGRTARWGLAWSFITPNKNLTISNAAVKSHLSFTLEGLQRQHGGFQVLKLVVSFFEASGAACKADFSSFCVNITLSNEQLATRSNDVDVSAKRSAPNTSSNLMTTNELSFRISVFEQIPGTVLIKGSMLHKCSPNSGVFTSLFLQLEEHVRKNVKK